MRNLSETIVFIVLVVFVVFLALAVSGCVSKEVREQADQMKVFNSSVPSTYKLIGSKTFEWDKRDFLCGRISFKQDSYLFSQFKWEVIEEFGDKADAIGEIKLTETDYYQIIQASVYTKTQ